MAFCKNLIITKHCNSILSNPRGSNVNEIENRPGASHIPFMVKITAKYTGGFHCELEHGPSHSSLQTDAPKDNMGKGEAFSPTDLVAAALSSCILTTMAIVAERDGVDMKGAHCEIEKNMSSAPRRIASLPIVITLPKTIPQDYRPKLEKIAHSCPVAHSLHPDVKIETKFLYE